jgi:hypothetical protein
MPLRVPRLYRIPCCQHHDLALQPMGMPWYAQESLAKTFPEDAGMRPKVLHPESNKPQYNLSTRDIEGNIVSPLSYGSHMPRGNAQNMST